MRTPFRRWRLRRGPEEAPARPAPGRPAEITFVLNVPPADGGPPVDVAFSLEEVMQISSLDDLRARAAVKLAAEDFRGRPTGDVL
jgi:hypothetical protein